MSSTHSAAENRARKNLVDAFVFGGATVLSIAAILEFGPLGLAAGSVLLSAAAAIVVGREEGVTSPSDEALVTDGGRQDD